MRPRWGLCAVGAARRWVGAPLVVGVPHLLGQGWVLAVPAAAGSGMCN